MARNKPAMSPDRREILRLMAADMLVEANERGDLDWVAVAWAVNRLLVQSNHRDVGALAA